HLVAQPSVELRFLEHSLALGNGRLETLPDPVQEDAALAVAYAAQRLRELAFAAQITDARVVELRWAGRSGDRGVCLGLVRLPVHGADCGFFVAQKSSSFVSAGRSRPGSEREVRRCAPSSRFRPGAR